jgi:acyl-CoA hydrolase
MELDLTPRPVRATQSIISEMALPNDANPLGNLIGGKIMHLVDVCAAIAANRHSRVACVTASVDYMTFLHPVHIGELVTLRSSVNRAFNTSMEIGVKVWVENLKTGEVRHTSSAYLTFVAIDAKGNRIRVAPVVPESADEIRRYEEAGERRKYRLELKARAGK